jgi:hypothetical protein
MVAQYYAAQSGYNHLEASERQFPPWKNRLADSLVSPLFI